MTPAEKPLSVLGGPAGEGGAGSICEAGGRGDAGSLRKSARPRERPHRREREGPGRMVRAAEPVFDQGSRIRAAAGGREGLLVGSPLLRSAGPEGVDQACRFPASLPVGPLVRLQ